MKRYMIPNLTNKKYPAQERDMALLLDRVGHHWPDAGMGPQMVEGVEVPKPGEINVAAVQIQVWVNPKRDYIAHRVMCLCPGCKIPFSVGRLAQHVCKGGM